MYLKLGTIVKQVGLKGELKIYSTTTFAKERFKKGNKVFVLKNNEYKEFTVNTFRILNSDFIVVSFEELSNLVATEEYLKCEIFAIKDQNILSKNQFYYVDLIDCKLISQDGEDIGKVTGIEEFPAQITLECSNKGKSYYVPFISQFILNVNIENKTITVNVIEGLLWNLQF